VNRTIAEKKLTFMRVLDSGFCGRELTTFIQLDKVKEVVNVTAVVFDIFLFIVCYVISVRGKVEGSNNKCVSSPGGRRRHTKRLDGTKRLADNAVGCQRGAQLFDNDISGCRSYKYRIGN